MTNIPANVTPARPPALQTRAQADLLAIYRNRIEMTPAGHYSISDQLAPDGANRIALQHRRAELVAAFAKSDPNEIVRRVARVFMRFPSMRIDSDALDASIMVFATDLARFPLWAIDQACISLITGQENTSKTFAPSSLEMQAACERVLAAPREELADLTRVLDAEVYHEPSPEQRAATHAKFRELVEELKLNVDPRDHIPRSQRPPTRNEAIAALDALAANPQPLPGFSDGLRAKLGMKPAQPPRAENEEAA